MELGGGAQARAIPSFSLIICTNYIMGFLVGVPCPLFMVNSGFSRRTLSTYGCTIPF